MPCPFQCRHSGVEPGKLFLNGGYDSPLLAIRSDRYGKISQVCLRDIAHGVTRSCRQRLQIKSGLPCAQLIEQPARRHAVLRNETPSLVAQEQPWASFTPLAHRANAGKCISSGAEPLCGSDLKAPIYLA